MPVVRFFKWLSRILSRKRNLKLGLIGAPNTGKTTLANRICMEWCGEEMGEVSDIPHETRVVQSKNYVEVKSGSYSVVVDLFDTPGLSTHDDLWEYYKRFIWYGFEKESADKRINEARKGIKQTLDLLEQLDAVVLVLDVNENPEKQVGEILLDILDRKGIPVLIAANKIDLVKEDVQEREYSFLGYPVVPISALDGTNMTGLYEAIYQHLKK